MSRKSTLSAESLAILNYLQEHGACSLDVLLGAFQGLTRAALLKRLSNLVYLHWLVKTVSSGGVKSWELHASARGAVGQVAVARGGRAPAKRKCPAPAPPRGQVAMPRRISFKEGTYTPSPSQILRPGALDFQRVASVGNRC